jgi:hypothetical protein
VDRLHDAERDARERAERAEAALRESEGRLLTLSDNLPHGAVYQVQGDEHGRRRFLYISAGVEWILGVTPAEAMADAAALYGLVHPAGPVVLLKRGLLLFWAAWLGLVFATNVLDGARALGLLEPSWAFASGNYAFLCQTTARYGTPAWVNGLLFGGVIGWQGLAAVLFALAGWTYRGRLRYPAFAAGLSLWVASTA